MTATNPLSSFGSFNYNFGNSRAGQSFFDSYTTKFPTFNSNVKVTPGLPASSKPQDYSSNGTRLPENASVNKSGVVTVKVGDYAADSKGNSYYKGSKINPATDSYGQAQAVVALSMANDKKDANKSFNTDKMTKDVGNVANQKLPPGYPPDKIKGIGLSDFPGNVIKGVANSVKSLVENPTGGPINRSTFPGNRIPNATRLMALPTNTRTQVAPATTPTAVAIAKSAPAAAPAPKPAAAPPSKNASDNKNNNNKNDSKNNNSKNDNNNKNDNKSNGNNNKSDNNNKGSNNSAPAASSKPAAQAAPAAAAPKASAPASAPKAAAPAPAPAKAPEPAKSSNNDNKNNNKNDNNKNDNKGNNNKKK